MTAAPSIIELTPHARLFHGDCRAILREMPSACVDAVVTDPPYAEIDRDYGRLTEPEWHALMDVVVTECRRILKPTGSAVFIIAPNSERVGRMRPWVFEFMARWSRDWNLIQDVYWWNPSAMPTIHCNRTHGLMRPSVKPCVWLGPAECYRSQDEVLWTASDAIKAKRHEDRALRYQPSGHHVRDGRIAATVAERGWSTPLNLIPASGSGASTGHGAATPLPLCSWWVRYLCPPGGVVLDPFSGSGTVGIAARDHGCAYVGIEQMPAYVDIQRGRFAASPANENA